MSLSFPLGTVVDQVFINGKAVKKIVKKEVERKLSGYKNQDTKKNIYDNNYFITYYDALEKLVISKLKCFDNLLIK